MQTTISVRGEARRTVPPDQASINATISAVGSDKTEAVERARAIQDGLAAALEALGGVRLTTDTRREAITFSSFGWMTHPEYGTTGTPTGRSATQVSVVVVVRDLGRVNAVDNALAGIGGLEIHSVSWSVDDDNPAWPSLRSDAIAAAVERARHYAAAVRGTLAAVDHIADVGLLDGDHSERSRGMVAMAASLGGRGGPSDFGGPSLDPVPQELIAVVEARCTATADDLIR